jgi:hypothetical protein
MIDKTMQDVQKELLAAVQRGHEQVRKGQDRVRKSQEQVRKSREAVTGIVTELTKSVRPSLPALPTVRIPNPADVRAQAREFVSHAMTVQQGLADTARHAAGPYADRVRTAQRDLTQRARQTVPYAQRVIAAQQDLADRARRAGIPEQVAAAQRTLTERVMEAAKVATPFIAEGRARLSQVARGLTDGQTGPAADGTDAAAVAEVGQLKAAAAKTAEDDPAAAVKPKARAAAPKSAAAAKAKKAAPKAGAAGAASTKARTAKK